MCDQELSGDKSKLKEAKQSTLYSNVTADLIMVQETKITDEETRTSKRIKSILAKKVINHRITFEECLKISFNVSISTFSILLGWINVYWL